jgi:hypothetical protein
MLAPAKSGRGDNKVKRCGPRNFFRLPGNKPLLPGVSSLNGALRRTRRDMMTGQRDGGLDRRQTLKCMAWAGTGVVWTVAGGVPSSRLIGGAKAAEGGFSFVQISDCHIGFEKPANPDARATLNAARGRTGRHRRPDSGADARLPPQRAPGRRNRASARRQWSARGRTDRNDRRLSCRALVRPDPRLCRRLRHGRKYP